MAPGTDVARTELLTTGSWPAVGDAGGFGPSDDGTASPRRAGQWPRSCASANNATIVDSPPFDGLAIRLAIRYLV